MSAPNFGFEDLPPEPVSRWRRLGRVVLDSMSFIGQSMSIAYSFYEPSLAAWSPAEQRKQDLQAMRQELDDITSGRTVLPDYVPDDFLKNL